MNVWSFSVRARGDLLVVALVLRLASGHELDWVDVPPVRNGHLQEAELAAGIVATASGGAITAEEVLRELSAVERQMVNR
jgi:hypothetical protein